MKEELVLYHNTSPKALDSILKDGLLVSKSTSEKASGFQGIWATTHPSNQSYYGGVTLELRLPSSIRAEKVNDDEYVILDDVAPEYITNVDYRLFNNLMYRQSELKKYKEKYSEDKVKDVILKHQNDLIYDIDKTKELTNFLNWEKDIKEDIELDRKAIELYGTTTNPLEAGYLTTDGIMIDFSGRKQGWDGINKRNLDHREIADIFEPGAGEFSSMIEYMNMGNVRLMPESPGFCLIKEPTEKQYDMLRKYAQFFIRREHIFYIDIMNLKGDNIKSFEFNYENIYEMTSKLKDYFNGTLNERVENLPDLDNWDEDDDDYNQIDVWLADTEEDVIDVVDDGFRESNYKVIWDANIHKYILLDPWTKIHSEALKIAFRNGIYPESIVKQGVDDYLKQGKGLVSFQIIKERNSDMTSGYLGEDNYTYEYVYDKFNVLTRVGFNFCPLYKYLGKPEKTFVFENGETIEVEMHPENGTYEYYK